jgi:hypothetical protein
MTGIEPVPSAGRRLHWAWTLGLTALPHAGGAAAALHSPWFKLQHVEVLGAERSDVAGRLAEAGVGPGAFMIWLRPGAIEAAVAADPWVAEVHVERVFPDRLVVEVIEEVPALWAGTGDAGWMLVSRRGVVVTEAEQPGAGLLRVRGPHAGARPGERPDGPEWRELVDLGLALSPGLAGEAWAAEEGGEWWLEARGWRARLGPAADLADKGRTFEALLASGVPEGAAIDLVAPTRPAITLPGAHGGEEGEALVEGEGEG